jgi:hypothetical protein
LFIPCIYFSRSFYPLYLTALKMRTSVATALLLTLMAVSALPLSDYLAARQQSAQDVGIPTTADGILAQGEAEEAEANSVAPPLHKRRKGAKDAGIPTAANGILAQGAAVEASANSISETSSRG